MGQYYYLDGTDPLGPFSLQEVYLLIDREVVDPATLVCREGGAEWQALVTWPELRGKSNVGAMTRVSSAPAPESKRHKKPGNNVTVIIIAVLLSAVAVYITYAITHASQESARAEQEINRLLER